MKQDARLETRDKRLIDQRVINVDELELVIQHLSQRSGDLRRRERDTRVVDSTDHGWFHLA